MLVFLTIDSKPIVKNPTPEEKHFYLREIQKDITYFRKTYKYAHLRIDISDLDTEQTASQVKKALEAFGRQKQEQAKSEQSGGK